MSLFFDVTNATGSRQMSGLIRVSTHLRQALISILGGELIAVVWHGRKGCFLDAASRKPVQMQSTDFFLTAEVFSSRERKGFYTSLENSGVKKAAVFHDAIPYLLPEITWPRSVERHPLYMNDLLRMDHIFCVSESSRCDLQHYWKEQASEENPSTSLVTWGA
ncbi:MAG: hypothetical protein KJT03_07475, partial [Verrucomicrobiae bacterium]|nr:hypothetical protein [Verrucomicrobiae bacterium]